MIAGPQPANAYDYDEPVAAKDAETTAEEMSALAAQGDMTAAALVIAEHLPYWMGAARGMTRHAEDTADLVQDAVTKLLAQWRAGKGPQTNTRAYVTATMRNAHASRLRSPGSRLEPLDETDAVADPGSTEHSSVDLTLEIDAVRRALGTLSEDHRVVLTEIVVQGRKPAELVEVLSRPAPAISSLLLRAKHALHRALLVDALSNGERDCHENARALPKRVHRDPAEHRPQEGGIAHVRSCARCRGGWARFAAMASALGVLPLFTVAQLSATAAPAAASQPEPQPESPPAPRATAPGSPGGAPALAGARAPTAPKALIGVGALLLTVSAGAFIAQLAVDRAASHQQLSHSGAIDGDHPHDALFDADLSLDADGALSAITLRFGLSEPSEWRLTELVLALSPGTLMNTLPPELKCTSDGVVTRCSATDHADDTRSFAFGVSDTSEASAAGAWRGEFSLQLEVETSGHERRTISGQASGRW